MFKVKTKFGIMVEEEIKNHIPHEYIDSTREQKRKDMLTKIPAGQSRKFHALSKEEQQRILKRNENTKDEIPKVKTKNG